MTALDEGRSPGAGGRPSRLPGLADGVELIGQYEDSGFKEPPYIARRADGQVLQLTQLLFLVAEGLRATRDPDALAQRVSQATGRTVSPENVSFLVDQRLRPLGMVANADGSQPQVRKRGGHLLALRYRTGVVPPRVVRAITAVFRPLFWPGVILAALAGLAAVDVWLFFVQGLGESVRSAIYAPATLFLIFLLVAVSAAFHECGHATGCRYGGAEPGEMGAGIYLVWPAFYTDVTDSYRLDRRGRLRTDLGGIYFNILFVLLTAAVYLATRFEPLLLVILAQHMEILRHFLPFVRLDGYYIFSDLTGVPDLFSRMGPILRSALPGREPDERVTALKPWARRVVKGWVAATVLILGANVAILVLHLPRILATTWDSLLVQLDTVRGALADGSVGTAAFGVLQLVALLLPIAGVSLVLARHARRLPQKLWSAASGRPLLRGAGAVATAGLATAAAFLLWPNGEYRPLQEGERYTVQDAVSGFRHVRTGRPSLTVERQQELGGAPSLLEQTPRQPGADASLDGADVSPSPSPDQSAGASEPTEGNDDAATAEPDAEVTATPTEAEATVSPEPTESPSA